MRIEYVNPNFIDRAWKDGASCLGEAIHDIDEITGDQLKMLLSRNERTLVRLIDEDETVGWGAFRIDQLPNIRVLHITDLVCRNSGFERFFEQMKQVAENSGCSRIRCCGTKVHARLYKMKAGFESVYETLEVKL